MEVYRKWTIDGVSNKDIEIYGIHDDFEGFRVLLRSHHDRVFVRLYFPGKIFYRAMDESYYDGRWKNVDIDERGCSLYKVKNSELLKWLHTISLERLGGFDIPADRLTHFFIETNSTCVDVVATGDVEVEIRD